VPLPPDLDLEAAARYLRIGSTTLARLVPGAAPSAASSAPAVRRRLSVLPPSAPYIAHDSKLTRRSSERVVFKAKLYPACSSVAII
jgi:hypothetical protein